MNVTEDQSLEYIKKSKKNKKIDNLITWYIKNEQPTLKVRDINCQ